MTVVIRWSWLLGLALFLPVSLPAGGLETKNPAISRFASSNSFVSAEFCFLQASPLDLAPTLRILRSGTPLEILRSWHSTDGRTWLHVEISSNQLVESSSFVRRGWLRV